MLKCFTTLFRCIRVNGRAFDSICKPSIIHTVSFLLKPTPNFHIKCKSLGTPFLRGNGILCYNKRHPLMPECLLTVLDTWGCLDELLIVSTKPVMVNTGSLLPKTTLKYHVKCQLLDSLSTQKMGWCAARRDIHCFLSLSWHSLDVQGCLYKLLSEFSSPLWSTPCNFYWKQLSK